jgi:hypothetical protein
MSRAKTVLCGMALAAALAYAEAPQVRYTATTANVSGAPDAIRIDILRWSTDAERDRLMDAWMLKTANPSGRGGGGRAGGRGAGRAGRGASEAPPAPKPTPEAMLATALNAAPTVGYLWSREVAGYAIRYAARIANPDGSERVVILTNRRLGAVNDLWQPSGGDSLPYDFSLIELRLNSHGTGEGKTSLTGKVVPDAALKMVALENYDGLPVVFSAVSSKAQRKSE